MRLHRRMEPDTVRRRRGSIIVCSHSKAALAVLLFLACWSVPLLAAKPAQAQEKEIVLSESGIHYPGGFDANTVGKVRGKAFGYFRSQRGPVRFQVTSANETYTVLACPPWYWKDVGAKISNGAEVVVRGSKSLGKDGKLYIIAQEIRILPSGKPLVFRNEDGRPLWKGPMRKTMGAGRGYGSSPRGMGGMRGGGGMRRGRR